jgi:hypothetical protein
MLDSLSVRGITRASYNDLFPVMPERYVGKMFLEYDEQMKIHQIAYAFIDDGTVTHEVDAIKHVILSWQAGLESIRKTVIDQLTARGPDYHDQCRVFECMRFV